MLREELAHWLKNYTILSVFAYKNNNHNNYKGGGGGGKKRKSNNDKFLFFVLFKNILQACLTRQDHGNKTEVTKSIRKTEQETKWKK